MNKLLIILAIALYGCKSTEKCDAYGKVTVCDTLVFEPMHIHEKLNSSSVCYEFPADTLEIDRELSILK
jgi:hypothetical protein